MVDVRALTVGNIVAFSLDRSARAHAIASVNGNWLTAACGRHSDRFTAEVPRRGAKPCAKCAAAIESPERKAVTIPDQERNTESECSR